MFPEERDIIFKRQKKRLEKKYGSLPTAHQENCKLAISITDHAT
jgi:hypothetical protein